MQTITHPATRLHELGGSLPLVGPAIRNTAFRKWPYMILLLLLDCFFWLGTYVALSRIPGIPNNYGANDLLPPLAVTLVMLSLIGGYNPRTKLASLNYASEHLISFLLAFLISALSVYTLSAFGTAVASSRAIFGASFAIWCVLSLYSRRQLWFAIKRLQPNLSFLVIADEKHAAQFYKSYTANKQEQNLKFFATDPSLVGRRVAGPGSPAFEGVAAEIPKRLQVRPERIYEGVVVAAAETSVDRNTLSFLGTLHFASMPVYTIQSFYEAYWEKISLDLLGPTWPLQAGFQLVQHSAFSAGKRFSDAVCAAAALLMLSPLLLMIAVALKIADPRGPVIFRQIRVGQYQRRFTLYKFRTMLVGSESGPLYTGENDSRITRFGSFLRRTRLDELPQLFNVLIGDMSLIGPRAEWIKCVERYEQIIPYYHYRHLVRPGITGWAQVNYPYGASVEDTIQKLKYDLYYIRNFSIRLDASVVLKTLHVMGFGKGR